MVVQTISELPGNVEEKSQTERWIVLLLVREQKGTEEGNKGRKEDRQAGRDRGREG